MSLGIPSNVVLAVLMGGFLIHGITPGPLLLKEHPDLFWGVAGSMYIGNVMLLVLNLPLIGIWVKILKVPYAILFALIFLFCLVGAYSLNKNVFDIFVMILFGIIGYLMKKFNYEAPPLVLAFILGPLLEENLRQSLIISGGSFLIFFSRPLSAVFVILTLLLLVSPPLIKRFRRQRSDRLPEGVVG